MCVWWGGGVKERGGNGERECVCVVGGGGVGGETHY